MYKPLCAISKPFKPNPLYKKYNIDSSVSYTTKDLTYVLSPEHLVKAEEYLDTLPSHMKETLGPYMYRIIAEMVEYMVLLEREDLFDIEVIFDYMDSGVKDIYSNQIVTDNELTAEGREYRNRLRYIIEYNRHRGWVLSHGKVDLLKVVIELYPADEYTLLSFLKTEI